MNPRTILLGVAALVAAGVTALLVQGWLDRQRANMAQRPAPVVAAGQRVLVAKTLLPAGRLIRPGDLVWQPWPENGVAPGYLVQGKVKMESFLGAVVRRGIDARTPITETSLVKAGDRGFLAAVLTPGKRAIAIPVSAATVIAGLIIPGDHVDIILSHKFEVNVVGAGKDGANKREMHQASETVVGNIRVLAVDQTTDDQKGKKGVPKTTTIEVTPKQAEMITLALNLGKLSLSLRSMATPEENNGKPARRPRHTVTRDTEVSRMLAAGRGRARGNVVHVLRGGKSEIGALEGVVK